MGVKAPGFCFHPISLSVRCLRFGYLDQILISRYSYNPAPITRELLPVNVVYFYALLLDNEALLRSENGTLRNYATLADT